MPAEIKLGDKYPDDLFDITDIPFKTVMRDVYVEGVRLVVLRANFSYTAYLGVPKDHPLAGFHYDQIPLEVHGGLTFSSAGDNAPLSDGCYWYGWDYAHSYDYMWDKRGTGSRIGGKQWRLGEVVREAMEAAWSMNKMMKLAEALAL